MQRFLIVDRNFLAGLDISQREKDEMSMDCSSEGVRAARVVDIVCAVAASASVKAPTITDAADAQDTPVSPPVGLGI